MGMESDVYAGFEGGVDDDVAIYGVELPSLTGANASLLLRSTEEQYSALADAIEALGPVPFAFYGHSMGAYIALQVARSLRAQNRRSPAFLALAAVLVPEVVAAL